MKRLISLLAVALFGVALVGCSDNEETTPPTPPDPKPVDVYGWHMTKWEVGGDDTNFPKEVYIVFDEEKNFEMYQDVSSNGFVKMTGTYTFDETSKKLTGKYSDGENWAYDYTVSGVDWLFGQLNQETGEMSGVGETMVMTAADDSTYKLTFVYGIIPDESSICDGTQAPKAYGFCKSYGIHIRTNKDCAIKSFILILFHY